jgi:Tfp pilus assembly protein PilP
MNLTKTLPVVLVAVVSGGVAWTQTVPGYAGNVRQTAETASRVAKVKAAETNETARKAAGADANATSTDQPTGSGGSAGPAAPELARTGKDGKISASEVLSRRGKRDPFVSIIQTHGGGLSNPDCAAGKKCLLADQLVLKGVVKQMSGMLAVVENAQRKAYFLREKDPVFNGEVVRITGDSIVFREKVYDKLGHEKMRDIVKRVPGSRPSV